MAQRILIASLTLAFGLGAFVSLHAQTSDEETAFRNSLAAQTAMEHAIHFLHKSTPASPLKAVDVLEKQIARANGNARYLQLLREAYRGSIQELSLAGRADLANTYQGRLNVLESAGTEPSPSKTSTKANSADEKKGFFPNFSLTNPFRRADAAPVKPAVVRAQSQDDSNASDPFDASNRRPPEVVATSTTSAQEFLTLAEREFSQRRFREARAFYERAYQVDPTSLQPSKDRYAYCLLTHLTEQVNAGESKNWTELKQQVESVIRYSPSLSGEGSKLLQAIEGRSRVPGPTSGSGMNSSATNVLVQHLGQNPEGWQVTKSSHFLFFHKRDSAFAEQIAQRAEETRVAMSRKWFGVDTPLWEPKCEVILHPNASHYTQETQQPSSSPGHSRIERDPHNPSRVVRRRVDLRLDLFGMMEGVLPHETTHVVLAGQFGPFDVPRWVDEGIAVLSETETKIDQHRQNLLKAQKEGTLFRLRDLMQLQDYPHARQISAFYAQSVVLVEWLTQVKGPIAFTQFVKDGLREGYDVALRRHYAMDMNELERRWDSQVMQNLVRVAANRTGN